MFTWKFLVKSDFIVFCLQDLSVANAADEWIDDTKQSITTLEGTDEDY